MIEAAHSWTTYFSINCYFQFGAPGKSIAHISLILDHLQLIQNFRKKQQTDSLSKYY